MYEGQGRHGQKYDHAYLPQGLAIPGETCESGHEPIP
jgi:hypothetical protein